MGATPIRIMELVAVSDPSAIAMPDEDQYGDTCIHIICRNAQTSADKLERLLQILQQHVGNNKEELTFLLQRRNRFGGTALHSAANHNALLKALRLLVAYSQGQILRVTTHDGIHAVTALWSAYTQTIPGHMKIVQILQQQRSKDPEKEEDDDDDPNHPSNIMFERFWTKVEYLATQYFALSRACPIQGMNDHTTEYSNRPEDTDDDNADDDAAREVLLRPFVLHGLLQCNVPIQLFQVCLQHRPETIGSVDVHGNTPLHVLLENRPYRLKEREAVESLLSQMKMASSNGSSHDLEPYFSANCNKESPLKIALRNKIPFDNAIQLLITACPNALKRRDTNTGLYPFQFAAHVGGGTVAAVDTTFRLLLAQPDLLVRSGCKK
jgi:ankyrin repeat protein